MLRSLLILLALAALLAGCATTSEQKDALDRTLRAYERAVRWNTAQAMYAFAPQSEQAPATAPSALEDIKVTAYDVLDLHVNEARTEATQRVRIKYYRLSYAREVSIIQDQKWRYAKDKERWSLISAPPRFDK